MHGAVRKHALQDKQNGRRRHTSKVGENVPFVIERSLIERECAFQRIHHLGTARMAHEAFDIFQLQIHSLQNAGHGRIHICRDKSRDRPSKNDAESFRVHFPSHNVERIRPKVFAHTLNLNFTAISSAQDSRRRAVPEQTGRDNVRLGQFIQPERKRAKFL